MTYKLHPLLRKIVCPVVLDTGCERCRYQNGEELLGENFEKAYLVESITALENEVVVTVSENVRINENGDSFPGFF